MSLSIPFPRIRRRSVWDLCALNNAVLKGQEGDVERVNAVASCIWRGWGPSVPRLKEAAVNFQVSSNNEMHTVNVKQHPLTNNPPQLGNNEWLSLRPPTNSFQQRNQQAAELFVGRTSSSRYIPMNITQSRHNMYSLIYVEFGEVFWINQVTLQEGINFTDSCDQFIHPYENSAGLYCSLNIVLFDQPSSEDGG